MFTIKHTIEKWYSPIRQRINDVFIYNLMACFLILAELYQFYTETFIHKEIRRTVCRNISKTSLDFRMGTHLTASPEKGEKGSSSTNNPVLKQSNLWRDLPSVRDSGVLQTLSPEECKYQEVSRNPQWMCYKTQWRTRTSRKIWGYDYRLWKNCVWNDGKCDSNGKEK